jgi:hypothetical protein
VAGTEHCDGVCPGTSARSALTQNGTDPSVLQASRLDDGPSERGVGLLRTRPAHLPFDTFRSKPKPNLLKTLRNFRGEGGTPKDLSAPSQVEPFTFDLRTSG